MTPVRCSPRAFEAVIDLYSKDRTVIYVDPLYLAQDLVLFGYFPKSAPLAYWMLDTHRTS